MILSLIILITAILTFALPCDRLQKIFVKMNGESFFFQLHIRDSKYLSWFHKKHRAPVMVIPRFAIQYHIGFQFLKTNNIEIACDLHVCQRIERIRNQDQAEQWMLRRRKTLCPMQLTYFFKMPHTSKNLQNVISSLNT